MIWLHFHTKRFEKRCSAASCSLKVVHWRLRGCSSGEVFFWKFSSLQSFKEFFNTWVLGTNFSHGLEVKIDNVEETEKVRNNRGEGGGPCGERWSGRGSKQVGGGVLVRVVSEWRMLVTFPPFSLYQILPVTFDACKLAYMRTEGRCFDNNHGNDNKMATFWIWSGRDIH